MKFGVKDSLLLRIESRFLAVTEGDTKMSSTVTESMQGQSFPWMMMSSVLCRLSLRWCPVVQAEMSTRHFEMHVAMWVSGGWGKRGKLGCRLHNSDEKIHEM